MKKIKSNLKNIDDFASWREVGSFFQQSQAIDQKTYHIHSRCSIKSKKMRNNIMYNTTDTGNIYMIKTIA